MNKKKSTILLCIIAVIGIIIIIISTIKIIKSFSNLKNDIDGANETLNGSNDKNNNYLQTIDNIINDNSVENENLLTITNDKGITDDYWYYVIGHLENHSNNNYDEVLIQFIALDSDGYKLSTCSDIAYNLKSGEYYSFKATCVTDKTKVNSYKLNTIITNKK